MYVHVGNDFSYEGWWRGLRAGKVLVNNGPLIQPLVEGMYPGHTFRASTGEELSLEITLNLTTRDPISYLEIVKNGVAEPGVRLSDIVKAEGKLPPLKFTESGWFLIRAVTDVEKTYRF